MGNCNFLRQVKWRENYYRVKVSVEPRGGGGGLRISSHGNDRMRAKLETQKKSLGLQTKPKKFPGPKANPKKIPWRISKPSKFPESRRGYNTQQKKAAKIRGYYHDTTNPQIVLNIQTNTYLNQATPKKYVPNFPTQNKIPESKISNLPQKSFDHPRHLNSGVPTSTPSLLGVEQTLFKGHFT